VVAAPRVGKHIAFRGDLLHGVPSELAPFFDAAQAHDDESSEEASSEASSDESDEASSEAPSEASSKAPGASRARRRSSAAGPLRVSLLANLWQRPPCGVHSFAADAPPDAAAPPLAHPPAFRPKRRAPCTWERANGSNRGFLLSDAAHAAKTPPLPLALRNDPQRKAKHRDAAALGLLVFDFAQEGG